MKYLLNKKNCFGIFVGGVVLFVGGCARSEHNNNTYNISHQKTYRQELAGIHEAADKIRKGDSERRLGNYSGASALYREAYNLDLGSRHVSGFLLADVYEQLQQYDDAIALLDEMIKNRVINEVGIQKANAMKSRLIAAQHKVNR